MKMKVKKIVNKYKNMSSPLIGILSSSVTLEEVVRVLYSDDKKSLIIKKNNYIPFEGYETIYIPFENEVEIDCLGGFDFVHNNEQHTLIIMVPLIKEQQ